MKKKRIIISYSDVITNSSTEIFLIQGPDALRQMIGTGVYKKYQKDFLILKTEEDVEYFFRYQGKKGFNHNYSVYDLRPLLGNLFNLYFDMTQEFPDKEEDIWEMFKPKIMKRLKGSIIYIDLKRNQKIMKRLNELYPNDQDYSYEAIRLNNLEQKDLDMDGVLTDNSGIITNNFYIYSGIRRIGRIYGEIIYCCFRLGDHIKTTLPKELLDFFGGDASKNIYDSDCIIFFELNIKPPILKHLTLPFCIKKTINVFSATKEEFKGNNNYNFYTRNIEFKFLNKIITKTPINKITLIRNLPIIPNNILNILNYYEKKEENNN